MSLQTINTGTSANKGNGDSLRTAFNKINQNFAAVSTATTNPLASSLTGFTLSNSIVYSSLTQVGTLTNLSISGTLTVKNFSVSTSTVALGVGSGTGTQQLNSIAIGGGAGVNPVNPSTIAIGYLAGNTQDDSAIAIGRLAGGNGQGAAAVALGYKAGSINQGGDAIAIGSQAGANTQSARSIVINATGYPLEAAYTGLFMAPIRANTTATTATVFLFYNTVTNEVTSWPTGLGNYTFTQNSINVIDNVEMNLTTNGSVNINTATITNAVIAAATATNLVVTNTANLLNITSTGTVSLSMLDVATTVTSVDISSSGVSRVNTVTFADLTSQITAFKVFAPPASSVGQVGDKAGTLAYDAGFIYYCISDYNVLSPTANIWVKQQWSTTGSW